MKAATNDQIETIRKCAYNQTARDIAHRGIKLTWEQANNLDDQTIDWMRQRLGLRIESTDRGVIGHPADRYYIRIKTAPHQQWMVPSGWSWANLKEAKRESSKANARWMAVELVDGETGKKIRY